MLGIPVVFGHLHSLKLRLENAISYNGEIIRFYFAYTCDTETNKAIERMVKISILIFIANTFFPVYWEL